MAVRTARANPRTIRAAARHQRGVVPKNSPSLNRRRVGQGWFPGLWCVLRKIFSWQDLPSLGGQKVPCKHAIGARESVALVEPEADRIGSGDDRAFREWKCHHERRKSPADAAKTLARLGDCDRVVVERDPVACVDLDAGLLRIPQPMDLQPQ